MYLQKWACMKDFFYRTEMQTPLQQDKAVQQLYTTKGTRK